MARQLVLDLPSRPARGRAEFFVSAANAEALAAIDGWRDWRGGRLALVGPAGSGKTHLAHVWAAGCGARILSAGDLVGASIAGLVATARIVVEDAGRVAGDPAAEAALFHLHNALGEAGGHLLLTDRAPPAHWRIALPDLASRMTALPLARIGAADDALLSAVLVKLFADRGLVVAPSALAYLATRMERSLAAAGALVARLDRAALAGGGGVTRSLVARVLEDDVPGEGGP